MKVLVIEPHKRPEKRELADLKDMQECVGGCIEAVYPWPDAQAALVCDEEGLFKDTEWNRYVCEGMAIKGTFFICGVGEEDFEDLPDELLKRFEREFEDPHSFLETPNGLLVFNGSELIGMIR